MTELIFEVRESPEGGYEARALGAAIFTEADSADELRANVLDAVKCHFDPGTRGFPQGGTIRTLHIQMW